MNARQIQWRLAQMYGSPFVARRHLAVVPNVSSGFFPWESDLLIVTNSLYLNEVEIKLTMEDFRRDAAKDKFGCLSRTHRELIRRFFYAAPKKLADKIAGSTAHGVIALDDYGRISILKRSPLNKDARKITEPECIKIMRLAALKAWDMAHQYQYQFGQDL